MDFNKLRLKYAGDAGKMDEILQAECRHKTARKLADTLACEGFRFPSLAVAEMATSDAVAREHCRLVSPGDRVIDMTSGLGIDTFAFARSGCDVTAVELDPVTAREIIHNAGVLGLDNVRIINDDSVRWLRKNPGESFDVIFIDPARRDNRGRHFALADCVPDVTSCLDLLLSRCRRLVIKSSPMLDIAAVRRELPRAQSTLLIGTRGECKELVTVIPGDGSITCITMLGDNRRNEFKFDPADETAAIATFGLPAAGGFLYEPYPAVMKSGAVKLLSTRFGVAKLHVNTHLYYSPVPVHDFPGEEFVIDKTVPFDKKGIKSIAARYPVINVATRNFPLPAPDLARRLKTKDGGDRKLFGTTVNNSERVMIISRTSAPSSGGPRAL